MNALRLALRELMERMGTDGVKPEDPRLHDARVVAEQEIFEIMVSHGMRTTDAREWARLLLKEMMG